VGRGHGFFEWIEIYDHQIDRLDVMLLHLALMILVGAPRQDSAVNFRMQRLDASIEHLGQAGEIFDSSHFDSGRFQSRRGSSGRNDFHSVPDENPGQIRQTRLVRDAD